MGAGCDSEGWRRPELYVRRDAHRQGHCRLKRGFGREGVCIHCIHCKPEAGYEARAIKVQAHTDGKNAGG